MEILIEELKTEEKQKEIVFEYVRKLKQNIYETINIRTDRALCNAIVGNHYPITQYLFAISANTAGGYDIRYTCEKFTDGKALTMCMQGAMAHRNLLKIYNNATPEAVNEALRNYQNYKIILDYKIIKLIKCQALKGKASGRLLFEIINHISTTVFDKILIYLALLIGYRKDTQLIRDVYKEILKVIHKSPPARAWEASQAQCIENMLAPVLYETIKDKFSTTVTKPDPEKLTSADIHDIRCSEIGYKCYLQYSILEDILDITDDIYYIDALLFKQVY